MSGDFSMSIWARRDFAAGSTIGVFRYQFYKNEMTESNAWGLAHYSRKALSGDPQQERSVFRVRDGGGTQIEAITIHTVAEFNAFWPRYTWKHLAGTYQNGTLRLYANGIEIAMGSGGSGLNSTLNESLFIGGGGVSVYVTRGKWLGRLNRPCLWNRALTPSEIQQLYADPWAMYSLRPRIHFPAAVAPHALVHDAALEVESPFTADKEVDTVAATGGTAPITYTILSQTRVT